MKILFYAKTLKKKLSTMKDGDSDLTRILLQKKWRLTKFEYYYCN